MSTEGRKRKVRRLIDTAAKRIKTSTERSRRSRASKHLESARQFKATLSHANRAISRAVRNLDASTEAVSGCV